MDSLKYISLGMIAMGFILAIVQVFVALGFTKALITFCIVGLALCFFYLLGVVLHVAIF
jgi:hypothetical protein